MKIEEEIKQYIFKSIYQKALISILYTASWINLRQIQVFKKFGLTPAQYNVLRILRGQYPKVVTVNLINDRMLDKSSNGSRIVEKLRVKKLVERVTCPEDRRAVNVVITTSGLDLLNEMDKIETELSTGVNKLTQAEASRLNDLLDKIRQE